MFSVHLPALRAGVFYSNGPAPQAAQIADFFYRLCFAIHKKSARGIDTIGKAVTV